MMQNPFITFQLILAYFFLLGIYILVSYEADGQFRLRDWMFFNVLCIIAGILAILFH